MIKYNLIIILLTLLIPIVISFNPFPHFTRASSSLYSSLDGVEGFEKWLEGRKVKGGENLGHGEGGDGLREIGRASCRERG